MDYKREISGDEFEELLRPKLRIFLSVDVIGSTHFKHSSYESQLGWLPFFVSFFNEFKNEFTHQIRTCAELLGKDPKELAIPTLWKSLGDELIFVAALNHKSEAHTYLKAFALAIRERTEHTELPLKGTAWIAGFPVGNAEIPMEGNNAGINESDFIGPQVDIGFRLAKFASPSKFIISADLAVLIEDVGGLNFYFDGKHPLKGVFSGRDYPIIWIKDEGVGESEDDDGMLLRPPSEKKALMKLCRNFIAEVGFPMMEPFVLKSGEGVNDVPVPGYAENYDAAKKMLQGSLNVAFDDDAPSATPTDPRALGELEELKERLKKLQTRTKDADSPRE